MLPILADVDTVSLVSAIALMAGANVWLIKYVMGRLTDAVDKMREQLGDELAKGRQQAERVLDELTAMRRELRDHIEDEDRHIK